MIKINLKNIKNIIFFILIINYYLLSINVFAMDNNNNKKRKEIVFENEYEYITEKKMSNYKLHKKIEEELEMKFQKQVKELKKNESNSKIEKTNNKKIEKK